MMSQAMILPDQSAIVSIALIVARTAGATSSGVCSGGATVAMRFLRSMRGNRAPGSRSNEPAGRRDDPWNAQATGSFSAPSPSVQLPRRPPYIGGAATVDGRFLLAGWPGPRTPGDRLT